MPKRYEASKVIQLSSFQTSILVQCQAAAPGDSATKADQEINPR